MNCLPYPRYCILYEPAWLFEVLESVGHGSSLDGLAFSCSNRFSCFIYSLRPVVGILVCISGTVYSVRVLGVQESYTLSIRMALGHGSSSDAHSNRFSCFIYSGLKYECWCVSLARCTPRILVLGVQESYNLYLLGVFESMGHESSSDCLAFFVPAVSITPPSDRNVAVDATVCSTNSYAYLELRSPILCTCLALCSA